MSEAAQYASAVVQAQQSGTLIDLGAQRASGMVANEAQQWLQHFGIARVELATDRNFKVQGGSFDLLLPIFESEQRLFFTQVGIRTRDGQRTSNVGLGQRHFAGDWMLGYNAFYDNNFNWGHQRIGVGTEAWRDNLKLSGNSYFRLSDWKISKEVDGYNTRPANGFDLRAEAYAPTFPQLGGKLMYEKYYGDEVGLFGSDKRQKNPSAMTAGLSFTPVPLISLSVDHKKGGSRSETQFGLLLTYQPGLSLSKHLSRDRVSERRTLAGSSMDFVERNNNIVFEYRRKQLINFTLPKGIFGNSRNTLDIDYTLTSKYGLSKITWYDQAIVAAGGRITDLGGGKYQLMLPPYRAAESNTYSLSGVAMDTRNNASLMASTVVTVGGAEGPGAGIERGSLTLISDNSVADGSAQNHIRARVVDDAGNPVEAVEVRIALTGSAQVADGGSLTILSDADGMVSLGITNTVAEAVSVRASTSGSSRDEQAVANFRGDPATASVIESSFMVELEDKTSRNFIFTESTAPADGKTALVFSTLVKDANSNPVADLAIAWKTDLGELAGSTSSTGVDGKVSMKLTSKSVGGAQVTAQLGGTRPVNAPRVSFTPAPPEGVLTDVAVDKDRVMADGTDMATYTATVKDAHGNLIEGIAVSWKTNLGSLNGGDGSSSSETDKSGVATINLTGSTTGVVQVRASVSGGSSIAAPLVTLIEPEPILLSYRCWGGNVNDPELNIKEVSVTAARYKYAEITGVSFYNARCVLE